MECSSFDGVYDFHTLCGEQSAAGGLRSTSDILPSEKPGIDGPGTWSDHRQRAAKGSKNNCYRLIASARQRDPQLHNV
jgi:hypothetical protein